MESPPSSSAWSDTAFVLSDDSGLLLTNGSISSGSMSGDSRSGHNHFPLEDSDCEDKSFSQDSLDGMSDIMCGEHFNTLKKGPLNWTTDFKHSSPIEPPLEFQDRPEARSPCLLLDRFSDSLASQIVRRAVREYRDGQPPRPVRLFGGRPLHHLLVAKPYYAAEFVPFSPCHGGRPGSRCSLGSSRLSSSHNSLSVPAAHRVDDSSFITQAVSHDTLSSNQISDLYNVPFDSDMYAVPIDVVRPPLKPKRAQQAKKRRRNTSSGCREIEVRPSRPVSSSKKNTIKSERYHWCIQKETKRHSVAGSSAPAETGEPIHMTLQEVRHYLQTLYSSSSDSSEQHSRERCHRPRPTLIDRYSTPAETNGTVIGPARKDGGPLVGNNNLINNNNNNVNINNGGRAKKNTFLINIKNKKVKDSSCDSVGGKQMAISPTNKPEGKRSAAANGKKMPARLFSFKQTLCNMFRFKRFLSPEHVNGNNVQEKNNQATYVSNASLANEEMHHNISSRALPPLPLKEEDEYSGEQTLDFATSIQRVKDYGWYWGPLPSEVAEKILSNEPDGSFIVRDSSDDHYIFSLTFKLNNCVRHVRIDHDQGNFSFGSCTKFKSQTIVEFIENAVEHSRSGRYLFFLHRRPVIGPVRVQLLHPVSRFKQVQSLQHICRFAIHKVVRRDLIPGLPLPRRMIDYLNTPHYYSEHVIDVEGDAGTLEQVPVPPRIPTPAIRRDYQPMDDANAGVNVNNPAPFNNYVVLNNNNNINNNNNVSPPTTTRQS